MISVTIPELKNDSPGFIVGTAKLQKLCTGRQERGGFSVTPAMLVAHDGVRSLLGDSDNPWKRPCGLGICE